VDDVDFSDEFCRFLREAVPAVDAAELLLLLHAQPGQWWSPAAAVTALRSSVTLSEAEATRRFAELAAGGLAAIDGEQRAQYRPASDELAAHVRTLAHAYRERPVTLIRVIYALRDGSIKSFADAFRLRKK
jgi:hypothetical protein